jgi:hypothetical protein
MLIVVGALTFALRRLFKGSSKFEGILRVFLGVWDPLAKKFRLRKTASRLTTNLVEEQQTIASVSGKPKGPAFHSDRASRPFS